MTRDLGILGILGVLGELGSDLGDSSPEMSTSLWSHALRPGCI